MNFSCIFAILTSLKLFELFPEKEKSWLNRGTKHMGSHCCSRREEMLSLLLTLLHNLYYPNYMYYPLLVKLFAEDAMFLMQLAEKHLPL